MEKKLKVVWTNKSLVSLRSVYEFYADKSQQAAARIVADIIEKAESIHFPEQYQQDEILPHYRRMIVRHYKILYKPEGRNVVIMDIFDTRQDPVKMKY